MSDTVARAAAAWGALFETMTPADLDRLPALLSPDARFSDPFNDTVGADAFVDVFRHMYRTVRAPRFVMAGWSLAGRTAYYRWRFEGTTRAGRHLVIEGMSEVLFDEGGLVLAHIDHWDAASQVYAGLPVIGPVIRWIRRRAAARP